MAYNFIETISKISAQGTASCFSCGYGETCKVGLPAMLWGPGTKITDDMIPSIEKQPELIEAAKNAGKLLALRLKEDHDRVQLTMKMQQFMMEKFKETT